MEVKEIKEQENHSNNATQKHTLDSTSKDESGFGEDLSTFSIQDQTFDGSTEDNSMDTIDMLNHSTVDNFKLEKFDSAPSLRKDDSGIYSEKSPSSGITKETSDGDFSESVSESFDDADMIEFQNSEIVCEKDCLQSENIKNKIPLVSEKETTEEEVKDLKSRDSDNASYQASGENKDVKLESTDCDKSANVECVKDICDALAEGISSENCDSGSQDNNDLTEFVPKTARSRAHVKLVDYDTNTDSDSVDSLSNYPVVIRSHRQYRKRKPDSDSEDDSNSLEKKVTENVSTADGTPVLLKHSQLAGNDPEHNVDISDLSSESAEESEPSPKQRHDSSSASETADGPPEISEFGPPRHKWRALFDLRQREFGYSILEDPGYFRKRVQGSLQMVQRFQLQYKMDKHEGCVNALHFNKIGTLLASGSDDLNIVIWNWIQNRPALIYDSGHRSNVFQAKFMPYSGDCHVVSCARDGQVRLADLSSTGVCKATKKIAQHRGAAHKLALEADSPHIVLSAGEDAVTFEIDLRQDKPNKLVTTKEDDKKVSIYSIHSNPINPNEFCLGGRDHFIRVYDKRKINEAVNDGLLKKFAPHHIAKTENSSMKANITCACYNYNGSEILGTYNDEDIYLFSNEHSDSADYIHRYQGHRNNQTVKGVNFYGPYSEFIVSGSDCGHIFLWDKGTENIVQYLEGDEGGVINVLEPHPFAPVLATSGLDHDVKIWAPTADSPTELKGLKKLIKRNKREREDERTSDGGMIDGSMLWFIMHHLRRGRRQRAREARAARGEPAPDEESSDTLSDEDLTTDDDSEDDDDGPRESIACNPS